ncbi:hypothetical protein L1887_54478 [Cichorium endivia]|nr:hypothetical protein L1887_54478 [Cichorium endivia]
MNAIVVGKDEGHDGARRKTSSCEKNARFSKQWPKTASAVVISAHMEFYLKLFLTAKKSESRLKRQVEALSRAGTAHRDSTRSTSVSRPALAAHMVAGQAHCLWPSDVENAHHERGVAETPAQHDVGPDRRIVVLLLLVLVHGPGPGLGRLVAEHVDGIVVGIVDVLGLGRDRHFDLVVARAANDTEIGHDLVRALGAPRDIVDVGKGIDADHVDKRRRHEQILDDRRDHMPWLEEHDARNRPDTKRRRKRDDNVDEGAVRNERFGSSSACTRGVENRVDRQIDRRTRHVEREQRKDDHGKRVAELAARRSIAHGEQEAKDDKGDVDVREHEVGNMQRLDAVAHGAGEDEEGDEEVGHAEPRKYELDGLVDDLDVERKLAPERV